MNRAFETMRSFVITNVQFNLIESSYQVTLVARSGEKERDTHAKRHPFHSSFEREEYM